MDVALAAVAAPCDDNFLVCLGKIAQKALLAVLFHKNHGADRQVEDKVLALAAVHLPPHAMLPVGGRVMPLETKVVECQEP